MFHITVFLAFFFGSCRNDKGPLDTQRSVNSLQETLLNSSFSYGSLSSKYNFKYIYIVKHQVVAVIEVVKILNEFRVDTYRMNWKI